MDRHRPQLLREELTEACANVRRQIEIQENSFGYAWVGAMRSGGDRVLDELRAELAQLEDGLANLGPDDA